ncbi:hypothetical protein GCM10025776_06080 [Corallincola platygyrae]
MGDFRIELDGNMVHVYPAGGFNELGVNALHKEVLRLAPTD